MEIQVRPSRVSVASQGVLNSSLLTSQKAPKNPESESPGSQQRFFTALPSLFDAPKSRAGAFLRLESLTSQEAPIHLKPVIIKPVGRIFEISDSNRIRGKCGKCGLSHPRKTRV